jgi:hypothetical protein
VVCRTGAPIQIAVVAFALKPIGAQQSSPSPRQSSVHSFTAVAEIIRAAVTGSRMTEHLARRTRLT